MMRHKLELLVPTAAAAVHVHDFVRGEKGPEVPVVPGDTIEIEVARPGSYGVVWHLENGHAIIDVWTIQQAATLEFEGMTLAPLDSSQVLH